MFSIAPELERLRTLLGNARTDALLARERREVFSVYPEIRVAAWGGVMLLVAAAGIVLKNNLDRLGPTVLALLISIAAVACYVFVAWRRERATHLDDYVLLLGALLVSADVAFIETQFHILGDQWRQHLLLVAVLHAVSAYLYRSRIVLSLAITSLASWCGVARNDWWAYAIGYTISAYLCVAILLVWRELDRRFANTGFARTIEHFAANLALLGSVAIMQVSVPLGSLVTLTAATAVIVWGFHVRSEWFVLYAFLYAVLAVDALIIDLGHWGAGSVFFILLSIIGAIVGLFMIHAAFRRMANDAE